MGIDLDRTPFAKEDNDFANIKILNTNSSINVEDEISNSMGV